MRSSFVSATHDVRPDRLQGQCCGGSSHWACPPIGVARGVQSSTVAPARPSSADADQDNRRHEPVAMTPDHTAVPGLVRMDQIRLEIIAQLE
jgi:hypothetical protein